MLRSEKSYLALTIVFSIGSLLTIILLVTALIVMNLDSTINSIPTILSSMEDNYLSDFVSEISLGMPECTSPSRPLFSNLSTGPIRGHCKCEDGQIIEDLRSDGTCNEECVKINEMPGIQLSTFPGFKLCATGYRGKDPISSQDGTCPEGYQLCGRDTRFHLCFPNSENCPLNHLFFSEKPVSVNQDYRVLILGEKMRVYFSNKQTGFPVLTKDMRLGYQQKVCVSPDEQLGVSEQWPFFERQFYSVGESCPTKWLSNNVQNDDRYLPLISFSYLELLWANDLFQFSTQLGLSIHDFYRISSSPKNVSDKKTVNDFIYENVNPVIGSDSENDTSQEGANLGPGPGPFRVLLEERDGEGQTNWQRAPGNNNAAPISKVVRLDPKILQMPRILSYSISESNFKDYKVDVMFRPRIFYNDECLMANRDSVNSLLSISQNSNRDRIKRILNTGFLVCFFCLVLGYVALFFRKFCLQKVKYFQQSKRRLKIAYLLLSVLMAINIVTVFPMCAAISAISDQDHSFFEQLIQNKVRCGDRYVHFLITNTLSGFRMLNVLASHAIIFCFSIFVTWIVYVILELKQKHKAVAIPSNSTEETRDGVEINMFKSSILKSENMMISKSNIYNVEGGKSVIDWDQNPDNRMVSYIPKQFFIDASQVPVQMRQSRVIQKRPSIAQNRKWSKKESSIFYEIEASGGSGGSVESMLSSSSEMEYYSEISITIPGQRSRNRSKSKKRMDTQRVMPSQQSFIYSHNDMLSFEIPKSQIFKSISQLSRNVLSKPTSKRVVNELPFERKKTKGSVIGNSERDANFLISKKEIRNNIDLRRNNKPKSYSNRVGSKLGFGMIPQGGELSFANKLVKSHKGPKLVSEFVINSKPTSSRQNLFEP